MISVRVCVSSVAGKLKGLFLLFAGYLVKSAASHLERTNCQDHVETNTSQGRSGQCKHTTS